MAINDAFPYSDGALSGQAPWATPTYDGSLDVSSGALISTAGQTRANLRTDTWGTTQSSTIELTNIGGHGGAYVGVICHGTDSGGGLSGYSFGYELSSGGTAGLWYLERITNGTTSAPLDDGTLGGVSAANSTITIGIDGNDVVAYFNGVEIGRGTDTTYRAGKPGPLLYFGSGTSPQLDNWVGTGEGNGSVMVKMMLLHH